MNKLILATLIAATAPAMANTNATFDLTTPEIRSITVSESHGSIGTGNMWGDAVEFTVTSNKADETTTSVLVSTAITGVNADKASHFATHVNDTFVLTGESENIPHDVNVDSPNEVHVKTSLQDRELTAGSTRAVVTLTLPAQ
ncbi:hypothetical protein [Vibrio variabilis]|uniref:hypothetical protein n=1 Tax=Vibrio variabilis TaxID=990271 RepID=UPI000DDC0968|nr:hypothetical protein [Vibrio variabilis]